MKYRVIVGNCVTGKSIVREVYDNFEDGIAVEDAVEEMKYMLGLKDCIYMVFDSSKIELDECMRIFEIAIEDYNKEE